MVHYVEGDRDAFEAAVAEIDETLEADAVGAGEQRFYAYVRCETTPLLREMFSETVAGEFVVVPPVVYRSDGGVTFSAFGSSGDIQAAIEGVPEPISVTVEGVGGLAGLVGPSRDDSASASARPSRWHWSLATTKFHARQITRPSPTRSSVRRVRPQNTCGKPRRN